MTPIEAVVVIAAGLWAGMINAIVGSGSLVSFPVLLAVGYSPVVANVSNTVGLVFGGLSAVVGYRRELRGQERRIVGLAIPSLAGGVTGAVLLLALPESAFESIVPYLILIACVLVALQPRLSRRLAAHRAAGGRGHGPMLALGVYLTAIYGGYFGAAQGVILISLLGILVDDSLVRLNALKNLLALFVNGIAAVLFIASGQVAWLAAVLIAVGAIVGGQVGAMIGRRMSPLVLRGAIIVIGTIVSAKLLTG